MKLASLCILFATLATLIVSCGGRVAAAPPGAANLHLFRDGKFTERSEDFDSIGRLYVVEAPPKGTPEMIWTSRLLIWKAIYDHLELSNTERDQVKRAMEICYWMWASSSDPSGTTHLKLGIPYPPNGQLMNDLAALLETMVQKETAMKKQEEDR